MVQQSNSMYSFNNQVRLTGRAGAAPSLRYLTDGTPCCDLRLYLTVAATHTEASSNSEAFRLTAFGDLAKRLHAAVRKGQRLYVEGSLYNNRFEHRGQTHIRTEVRVNHFLLVSMDKFRSLEESSATRQQSIQHQKSTTN